MTRHNKKMEGFLFFFYPLSALIDFTCRTAFCCLISQLQIRLCRYTYTLLLIPQSFILNSSGDPKNTQYVGATMENFGIIITHFIYTKGNAGEKWEKCSQRCVLGELLQTEGQPWDQPSDGGREFLIKYQMMDDSWPTWNQLMIPISYRKLEET